LYKFHFQSVDFSTTLKSVILILYIIGFSGISFFFAEGVSTQVSIYMSITQTENSVYVLHIEDNVPEQHTILAV